MFYTYYFHTKYILQVQIQYLHHLFNTLLKENNKLENDVNSEIVDMKSKTENELKSMKSNMAQKLTVTQHMY